MKKLVIVESPNKIKKISQFLGNDYIVRASFGHIRNLASNELSIDIGNNFKPKYINLQDKKNVINDLKTNLKRCNEVYLAADYDREGEAIAWHLAEVLKLKNNNTKRILFTEITKNALNNAIKNPTEININMFNSQQARRILDRLIGYKITPILWKQIQGNQKKDISLSAGRVQSIITKLIIEREDEINNFKGCVYFNTRGSFNDINDDTKTINGKLNKNFETYEEANLFINNCKDSVFSIESIFLKKTTKKPPAPFITSTLQQEASNIYHFSPKMTMSLAQKLYEQGYITYMRTDSVILSDEILDKIKDYVVETYGEDYLKIRKLDNKKNNTQEAHEAIRPCYINKETIDDNIELGSNEKKLYRLIWRRTVASQMSSAKINVYTSNIGIDNSEYKFIGKQEKVIFPGFIKLYKPFEEIENNEDENELESGSIIKKGTILKHNEITSEETYSKPSIHRYTEASLIKKLDDIGIGRPSTYSGMISIVQTRKYVEKKDTDGEEKEINTIILENTNNIIEEKKTIKVGIEKQKLFSTDIGRIVTLFLNKNFDFLMDYTFTAQVEDELDLIAKGEKKWVDVVKNYYEIFNPKILELSSVEYKNSKNNKLEKDNYKKKLGICPNTKKEVIVYIGKYGPCACLLDTNPKNNKYAPLGDYKIDKINLEDALELLIYPINKGEYNSKNISIHKGKYGKYIKYDSKNYKIPENFEEELNLEDCINIINSKFIKSNIKVYSNPNNIVINKNIIIKSGKYGDYIEYIDDNGKKLNVKIYNKKNKNELTLDDCLVMIKNKLKKSP